VNGDLKDHRVHAKYGGAWGYIISSFGPLEGVYLDSYDYSPIYKVEHNDRLKKIADAPRGHFYLTSLPEVGLMLTNNWTTGNITAFCVNDPKKQFYLRTGGMGRMLYGQGRQAFTPSASGYLTITFPREICE
jgi:hypothetical protein